MRNEILTLNQELYQITNKTDRNFYVAQQIMKRRRAIGMTQKDLAEACGYSIDTIRAMEQGRSDFSLSKLCLLSRVLDTNLSYLLGLCEIPEAGGVPVMDYEHTPVEEYDALAAVMRNRKDVQDELLKQMKALFPKDRS